MQYLNTENLPFPSVYRDHCKDPFFSDVVKPQVSILNLQDFIILKLVLVVGSVKEVVLECP